MQYPNIIFLDFDGVLSTPSSGYSFILSKCVLVKQLCIETNARIVLSTSWRHETLEETISSNNLQNWILAEFCIDVLPTLYISNDKYEDKVDCPRGVEILSWLMNNDYNNYVIFDDVDTMLLSQSTHFVHINANTGITEKDIYAAKCILNSKKIV